VYDFFRSYSGYPLQAFLSCCFFLRQKKATKGSSFFAKKKYNNPSKGFSLLSGLWYCASKEKLIQ